MTIDQKIGSQMAAMQVLTSSPLLDDLQRLDEFYVIAQAFYKRFGSHLVLADTSMQMLMNTRQPLGTPLPRLPQPKGNAAAPTALRTGNPAVGDMFFGPIAKEPLVAIAVPVIRNEETKLLLISVIQTSQFQQRLEKVSLPSQWSLTLLDGNEGVMARRSSPDADNSSGRDSRRFVAKSSLTPWSVVLEIPPDVHRAPIFVAACVLAAAILAVTLISVLGGWRASRKLAGSVRALAEIGPGSISESSIVEIEAVRRILAHTAEARELAVSTLLESEERYRDLYENAPDMHVSVDATTGKIVRCNQTFSRVTGYSREAVIGRPVFEIYHPESRENARKAFQVFRTAGNVHNIELQVLCADGRTIDVIMDASAVYDDKGAILLSRSSLRDITELKRAEQELRESEIRFRKLMEHSPTGISVCTLHGEVLYVNKNFTQTFGYSLEDIPTLDTWLRLAYPDPYAESVKSDWERETRRAYETDVEIEPVQRKVKCKDGTIRVVDFRKTVIDEWVIHTLVDVTETKRQEEALRASEERYKFLMEQSFDGLFLMSGTRIVFTNSRLREMLGYEEGELEGQDHWVVYHPDYHEITRARAQARMRGEAALERYEVKLQRKDGVSFDCEIIAKFVPVDGEPGVQAWFRDISERKKAEEELLASKAKLEAALASMSDAVFISDFEGNFVEFNEAFATFHKFKNKEECAKTLAEYPALLDVFRSDGELLPLEEWAVPRALRGETAMNAEYTLRLKVTGETWVGSYSFAPIRDQDGNIAGSVVTARDITEAKRAQEALLQSEERLRLAQDAAKAGPWEWDVRTNENFWSDELWELYGLEPQSCEPSYETWLQAIHPDDRAGAERAVMDASSKGLELNAEWRTNNEGDQRWLMSRGRPIRDANGHVLRYVGIVMDITDRKRAEDALIQSENRFRQLYEEAPVAYQSLDESGVLLQVNMAWLQLLGYSRDEVVGKRFSDFLSTRSQERFEKVFPEFKRAGFIYGIEHEMVCKDESIIDVSIDGRVSWTEDRKFRHTHCVFQDITQRKKAERALQENEQKYRATFNTASVGIVLVDSEGRFLEVNSTLAEFLGYTPEELGRLTVFDVTHPEDVGKSRELQEAIVNGKMDVYRLEKRYLRKDGSFLWADTSVSSLRDAAGAYRATVGVISDITQRKKLEEARSRLAAAVEQAAETVEITDANGTIVYVNPSFERTTGYSLQEVVGNNPRIVKSGRHDKEFYRHMWDTITRGNIWTGHLINKRKDGTLFEEDVSISPVKADSGEITNYVAVKRDVTKEVTLQRQLLQAQKMEAIGTLAGGMAHDFNNILQIVLGFSELMLAAKSKKDQDYGDLQKIHHAAVSGADLVRSLLTLGRKVEAKPMPIDLNNHVRIVKKLLQRTIPKMIDIKLDLAGDLMRINADSGQIEQIIMNLAVNARDAMGEKGTLTLKTENIILDEEYCRTCADTQPGEYVLLSISDTGHGMSRETLQRIFEPFYTTKELGRGTGLGLSMVYGIVNQHGGHIRCQSEIGLGSTFQAYFPAIENIEESQTGETDEVLALGTETILLVDDEDFVRDLGARILKKGGYTVLTAKNGLEALDLFEKEKQRISLVILDLIMPQMGGKGCLKELLKIDDKARILVASGSSADSTIKECFEIGAKGFVAKPFRIRELLREVRKILNED
jgi:PAS domain S-box-containing protein